MYADDHVAVDVESAATAVLEHLERSWNDAEGAAFGEVFADECDFVDIRGAHHRSAAAVGAGHQALFESIYRGSTIRYVLDTAREVVPGCVLAVAGATLDVPTGPARGMGRSCVTVVLTEKGDGWTVAAFHNTLLQEHS